LTAAGPSAVILPGSFHEWTSVSPSRPFDRHAHAHAEAVDGVGFGRQANELHVMAAERELGAEEGAVRGAEIRNLLFHNVKSRSVD
jgi:hypothetical protein